MPDPSATLARHLRVIGVSTRFATARRSDRTLFTLYFCLLPFMSALAPTQWLPLPLLFVMFMAPLALLRSQASIARDLLRDWGFFLVLTLGCAAMALAPIPLGTKNLNYTAAVFTSYALFLVVVRAWLSRAQISWPHIATAAHTCLTLLSIAILLEFYLASFHGIFFSDILPFAHHDLTIADLITSDFKRPRALSPEPGFTALCYECLWPLTLLAYGGRLAGTLRQLLYLLAFLLLASAAAMLCLATALVVVWVVRSRDLKVLFRALLLAALVGLLVGNTQTGEDLAWSVLGRKIDISTVQTDPSETAVTVLDRFSTYGMGLTLIEDHPFGIGWGTLAEAFADQIPLAEVSTPNGSGMLSLYFDIAVAAGIPGLIAFLFFVGSRVRLALRSTHPASAMLSASLLAVAAHHAFITEFQFPFLWLALALVDALSTTGRTAKTHVVGVSFPGRSHA